tara:strand:- start:1383 stop:2033 length:651 start_codon:yes stop_codon:yes gene_type:complete
MVMVSALITGAAKRIGKAIALHLAKKGFDIALHYFKSKIEAKKTQKEIQKHGVKCEIFKADLSNSKDIEKLLPSVLKKFKNVDLLVNNASAWEKADIKHTNMNLMLRNNFTNYVAPFYLTTDFAKRCKKGMIINMLDKKPVTDYPDRVSYIIPKKSMEPFIKYAAKELSPKIQVNGIQLKNILDPGEKHNKKVDTMLKKLDYLMNKKCNGKICSVT